tara:strand:+ start:437 stop:1336 length:900 start_codon:yes stop_codon:yes gene_type:complete
MVTQVTVLTKSDHILVTKRGFECAHCGKGYKTKSGLYRHVKKCASNDKKSVKNAPFLETKTSKTSNFDDNNDNNHGKKLTALEEALINQLNKKDKILEDVVTGYGELVETVKELKQGQSMGNNNTINSNNTNITVNMFLTEHCKDAMFLDDFVKNIKIRLQDVMNGELLEDNVISNVIVQKLEDLEPTKRPIHCTDPKRKKFVVNDKKDGWVKDSLSSSKSKLKDGLEDVQRNAFLNVYDEFDEKYKPPHEDQLEKKKSVIVKSLRDPLISGKGTDKIVRDVAEVSNIKEAIKSLKDNQ